MDGVDKVAQAIMEAQIRRRGEEKEGCIWRLIESDDEKKLATERLEMERRQKERKEKREKERMKYKQKYEKKNEKLKERRNEEEQKRRQTDEKEMDEKEKRRKMDEKRKEVLERTKHRQEMRRKEFPVLSDQAESYNTGNTRNIFQSRNENEEEKAPGSCEIL